METIPETQHEREQTDPQILNTATATSDALSSKIIEKRELNRSTIIATEEVSIKSRKARHPNYCPTIMLNSICPCCQELHEEEENVCCCHCKNHLYLCPSTAEVLSRAVCASEAPHNVLCSTCPPSVINHTVTYTICQDNSSTSTTGSGNAHNK